MSDKRWSRFLIRNHASQCRRDVAGGLRPHQALDLDAVTLVRPGRDKLKGLVEVDETYLSITDRKNPATPAGRKSNG